MTFVIAFTLTIANVVFGVWVSRPWRNADRRGFFGYLFAYQVLASLAALRGYGQYFLGSSRRWE